MLLARSSFVFMTIVTLFIPSTATTFEPKDLCDSLPDIPFPSSFSVSHKLRALVDVFDDASDLSWQSCGTNCDKAAHTFNATQTALAETSRALFSYTARLSVSTTILRSSACATLKNLNRWPSPRERICASLRDKVGYRCDSVDYRDLQEITIQQTWGLLEELALEISQCYHQLSHTLAVVDSRTRVVGRVIIEDLSDALESAGHEIHDLLETAHDFTKEQHRAIALYLMRDVRSMGAMRLLETSSKALPMRDVILTLIVGCHAIHEQLMGQ